MGPAAGLRGPGDLILFHPLETWGRGVPGRGAEPALGPLAGQIRLGSEARTRTQSPEQPRPGQPPPQC